MMHGQEAQSNQMRITDIFSLPLEMGGKYGCIYIQQRMIAVKVKVEYSDIVSPRNLNIFSKGNSHR